MARITPEHKKVKIEEVTKCDVCRQKGFILYEVKIEDGYMKLCDSCVEDHCKSREKN